MTSKITKESRQRLAEKAFFEAPKRRAPNEYEKEQDALRKNYERLRTERLAREAAKSEDK
jgi:hypothetical protein